MTFIALRLCVNNTQTIVTDKSKKYKSYPDENAKIL